MKRKLSVFTILLLIFSICGCKNHALIDDALSHKNNDEHVITLQLNESSNARSITTPEIASSDGIYYKIIITRDGNAKTYDFEKSETYNISVKNGINTFEIAGYKKRTQTESGYQYSTPLLYSNSSITIDSETESISLTVRPIIETYTQGELAGVADEGTVSFTVKMPSQAENSEKLKLISINGLPETIAYTFKDEDKSSSIVHTTDTKAAPGVYNCSIIVQTTDNQNFLYSQTVYCAMNLITPVFLDFSNESFSTESCGEIGYINFYDSNNSGTNLISFDEDTQNYTCYGIDRTNTYYLELTMKVAGQKIDVSIKKDGDTDFGSPLDINTLSGHKISFVDSNPAESNNYIQKLKYPFGTNQPFWMDATGGSEVKISVSKGGASKDYIIKLSPEVPVVPEDVEVSHPVDVSAMTALPDPVTDLTETTYVITNEAQLFALGTYVNGGGETTGMIFVLGENIALTSEWVPIGYDTDYPFMGIFDGNNYKISNLSITTHNVTHGFIGSMESGTILNLTVEGSINVSDDYVAGICAYVSGNSKINNCINNVIINGGEYCGGISAYYDGDSFEITNCVNFGSVTGHEYCSGFIGRISAGGTSIINCVNLADVTSDYSAAGIALTRNSTVIENSYNAGIISGTSCESPVSYGMADATLKDCYYLKDCTYESGELFVRNALGSATNSDAEDVSSFTHSSGDGNCTLTKTVNSKTDLLQALNSYSGIGLVYNEWVYSQNSSYKGLPVFKDTMARLNQVAVGGSCHKPIDATWKNITEYFSGDTVSVMPQSGETVVVSDVVELSKVNKFLASSNLDGVTIILNDDINFTNNKPSGFNNIYGSQKFSGTFDGNNYRIYNYSFKINSTYVGFIASLENGTICNLIIEGTSVECGNGCGAIAGQTSGTMTKIDNCIVKINVENASSSFYGGLVGYVGSGTTTIRNCINFGNVSAKERAGGLIGQIGNSATAVIENCANYGQITAVNNPSYSGGLVGYLGGTVSIENSFNYGECASGDPVCGYKAGSGSVSYINNCFYNSVYSSTSILENANKFSPTGANIEETKFIYNTSDLKTLLSDWAQDNTVVNQTYNKWDYKTMNLNGVDTRVLVFE